MVEREYTRIIGLVPNHSLSGGPDEFVAVPTFSEDSNVWEDIHSQASRVFAVNLSPQPLSSLVRDLTGGSTDPLEKVQVNPETSQLTTEQPEQAEDTRHPSQGDTTMSPGRAPTSSETTINMEDIENQLSRLLSGLSATSFVKENHFSGKSKIPVKSKKPSIKVLDKQAESNTNKVDKKKQPEWNTSMANQHQEPLFSKQPVASDRKPGVSSKPKLTEQTAAPKQKGVRISREQRLSERTADKPNQTDQERTPHLAEGQKTPIQKPSKEWVNNQERQGHVLRLDVTVGATLNMNIETRESRRSSAFPISFGSTKISSESNVQSQSQVLTGFDRVLGSATSPKLSIQLNYNGASQPQHKPTRESSSSHMHTSATKAADPTKHSSTSVSVRKLKQQAEERASHTSSKTAATGAQKTYEPLF